MNAIRTRWGSIAALLFAVFGVLMGNGVMTTLVPVRASLEGFPKFDIGLMGAAYFVGMLSGAFVTPALVGRTGAIKAFALSSLLGAAVLLSMPLIVHPWSWILLRGLSGFSLAGIYAVVESYMQGKAENRYRGRLLATYSVVQYIGWSCGGQLMRVGEPTSIRVFLVAVAIVLVVGLLPLLLAERDAPRGVSEKRRKGLNLLWLYRASPIGFVVTVLIGMANGPFWALTPVFGAEIGMNAVAIGTLMTLIAIGSALFQFPVGRLSDAVDRRWVIVGLTGSTAIFDFTLYLFWPGLIGWPLAFIGLVMGGLISTQYYTTSAHTNDRTGRDNVVNVSAALLFLYSIGAIIGPLTGSLAMEHFGPGALYLHNGGLHAAIAAFVLLRILRRAPPGRMPLAEAATQEIPVP